MNITEMNLNMRQNVFCLRDAQGNLFGLDKPAPGRVKILMTAEMHDGPLNPDDPNAKFKWPGPIEQARYNRECLCHWFGFGADARKDRYPGDDGRKFPLKNIDIIAGGIYAWPVQLKAAEQIFFDDVADPIYENIKVEITELRAKIE